MGKEARAAANFNQRGDELATRGHKIPSHYGLQELGCAPHSGQAR